MNQRILTIHLKDDYSKQDITVIDVIGEDIDSLYQSLRTFALAAGFHPDIVKEYFDADEV